MSSSSTPSIRISHHSRYHSPPTYPTPASYYSPPNHASSVMAIPRAQEPVPPPLPPPSFIPELAAGRDPGWQWGNDPNGDFGRPAVVKPGSSLLGSGINGPRLEKEHDFAASYTTEDNSRRGSSISTITANRDRDMTEDRPAHSNEDGTSTRQMSNYRLHSERQLEQRTLEDASNSYDKHLLSRIGGPNTPKRQSVSYSSSAQDNAPPTRLDSEPRAGQLQPLSLPERRHTTLDSPANSRWPSGGAISPGFTSAWSEHSPADCTRFQPPPRHGSLATDDNNVAHRGSYDQSMFIHEDLMEDSQMSSLNIRDRSPSGSDDAQLGGGAGTKRRASSPPREGSREERSSVSSASGQSDLYHRRSMQHMPNKGSPISRFHPNHSSVSSISSLGPRHGSLGSSLGVLSIPSSATSYGSERLSPNALSPAMEPERRAGTPYNGAQALPNAQQRAFAETSQAVQRQPAESIPHPRNDGSVQVQGAYLCECCPKKPKKFDTQEELRSHEVEKQYTCAYCPNRFKNKNEAERHQNSLHLRRHSWSCAALSGVEAAYHAASNSSGMDVCGYCGEEFSNPPQWDIRAEHLSTEHKFGECNLAKKFFRADHFRQHLKHSHGGTSGKWTNLLETACMKDEPPPEKRVNSGAPRQMEAAAPPAPPPTLMVTTSGLSSTPLREGQAQGQYGMIVETPHDA